MSSHFFPYTFIYHFFFPSSQPTPCYIENTILETLFLFLLSGRC